MLLLYHSLFSTCSQKVRLVLAEKQIEWASREIDFTKLEHLSEEYLRLNPNGVVPTLVHDGVPITDSSVICEYLDEVFPNPRLAPAGAVGRARMRAWMRYLEEVPTAAIRVPSFNKLFAPYLSSIPKTDFDSMTERLPLRKHFYQQMGPTGFDERVFDESIEKLQKTLQRLDAAVSGVPWLLGDDYSIADAVLTPIVVRMKDIGLSALWAELPHACAWFDRIQTRPSFDVAFCPGSRLTPGTFRPPSPSNNHSEGYSS